MNSRKTNVQLQRVVQLVVSYKHHTRIQPHVTRDYSAVLAEIEERKNVSICFPGKVFLLHDSSVRHRELTEFRHLVKDCYGWTPMNFMDAFECQLSSVIICRDLLKVVLLDKMQTVFIKSHLFCGMLR